MSRVVKFERVFEIRSLSEMAREVRKMLILSDETMGREAIKAIALPDGEGIICDDAFDILIEFMERRAMITVTNVDGKSRYRAYEQKGNAS